MERSNLKKLIEAEDREQYRVKISGSQLWETQDAEVDINRAFETTVLQII
jgi:hypothetical protein